MVIKEEVAVVWTMLICEQEVIVRMEVTTQDLFMDDLSLLDLLLNEKMCCLSISFKVKKQIFALIIERLHLTLASSPSLSLHFQALILLYLEVLSLLQDSSLVRNIKKTEL